GYGFDDRATRSRITHQAQPDTFIEAFVHLRNAAREVEAAEEIGWRAQASREIRRQGVKRGKKRPQRGGRRFPLLRLERRRTRRVARQHGISGKQPRKSFGRLADERRVWNWKRQQRLQLRQDSHFSFQTLRSELPSRKPKDEFT